MKILIQCFAFLLLLTVVIKLDVAVAKPPLPPPSFGITDENELCGHYATFFFEQMDMETENDRILQINAFLWARSIRRLAVEINQKILNDQPSTSKPQQRGRRGNSGQKKKKPTGTMSPKNKSALQGLLKKMASLEEDTAKATRETINTLDNIFGVFKTVSMAVNEDVGNFDEIDVENMIRMHDKRVDDAEWADNGHIRLEKAQLHMKMLKELLISTNGHDKKNKLTEAFEQRHILDRMWDIPVAKHKIRALLRGNNMFNELELQAPLLLRLDLIEDQRWERLYEQLLLNPVHSDDWKEAKLELEVRYLFSDIYELYRQINSNVAKFNEEINKWEQETFKNRGGETPKGAYEKLVNAYDKLNRKYTLGDREEHLLHRHAICFETFYKQEDGRFRKIVNETPGARARVQKFLGDMMPKELMEHVAEDPMEVDENKEVKRKEEIAQDAARNKGKAPMLEEMEEEKRNQASSENAVEEEIVVEPSNRVLLANLYLQAIMEKNSNELQRLRARTAVDVLVQILWMEQFSKDRAAWTVNFSSTFVLFFRQLVNREVLLDKEWVKNGAKVYGHILYKLRMERGELSWDLETKLMNMAMGFKLWETSRKMEMLPAVEAIETDGRAEWLQRRHKKLIEMLRKDVNTGFRQKLAGLLPVEKLRLAKLEGAGRGETSEQRTKDDGGKEDEIKKQLEKASPLPKRTENEEGQVLEKNREAKSEAKNGEKSKKEVPKLDEKPMVGMKKLEEKEALVDADVPKVNEGKKNNKKKNKKKKKNMEKVQQTDEEIAKFTDGATNLSESKQPEVDSEKEAIIQTKVYHELTRKEEPSVRSNESGRGSVRIAVVDELDKKPMVSQTMVSESMVSDENRPRNTVEKEGRELTKAEIWNRKASERIEVVVEDSDKKSTVAFGSIVADENSQSNAAEKKENRSEKAEKDARETPPGRSNETECKVSLVVDDPVKRSTLTKSTASESTIPETMASDDNSQINVIEREERELAEKEKKKEKVQQVDKEMPKASKLIDGATNPSTPKQYKILKRNGVKQDEHFSSYDTEAFETKAVNQTKVQHELPRERTIEKTIESENKASERTIMGEDSDKNSTITESTVSELTVPETMASDENSPRKRTAIIPKESSNSQLKITKTMKFVGGATSSSNPKEQKIWKKKGIKQESESQITAESKTMVNDSSDKRSNISKSTIPGTMASDDNSPREETAGIPKVSSNNQFEAIKALQEILRKEGLEQSSDTSGRYRKIDTAVKSLKNMVHNWNGEAILLFTGSYLLQLHTVDADIDCIVIFPFEESNNSEDWEALYTEQFFGNKHIELNRTFHKDFLFLTMVFCNLESEERHCPNSSLYCAFCMNTFVNVLHRTRGRDKLPMIQMELLGIHFNISFVSMPTQISDALTFAIRTTGITLSSPKVPEKHQTTFPISKEEDVMKVLSSVERVDQMIAEFIDWMGMHNVDDRKGMLWALSSYRANLQMKDLLKEKSFGKFKSTLMLLKLWAKNHFVYGGMFGLLNGQTLTVMLLHVFILEENDGSDDVPMHLLIVKFFNTYFHWDWPVKLELKGGEGEEEFRKKYKKYERLNWNQSSEERDRGNQFHGNFNLARVHGRLVWPVILPGFPTQNVAFNVNKWTGQAIHRELGKGLTQMHSIQQKIEAKEPFERNAIQQQWNTNWLDGGHFHKEYEHFVVIVCAAHTVRELRTFSDYVESRIRLQLLFSFEDLSQVKWMHASPERVRDGEKCGEELFQLPADSDWLCTIWLVGIELKEDGSSMGQQQQGIQQQLEQKTPHRLRYNERSREMSMLESFSKKIAFDFDQQQEKLARKVKHAKELSAMYMTREQLSKLLK